MTASASALASKTSTGLPPPLAAFDHMRPEPAIDAVPRRTPPATRRWPSGRVVLIGAGDFEDRDVAVTLVGIALRGRSSRPGSSDGRMSDMSAAIGLASFSAAEPPPKSFA